MPFCTSTRECQPHSIRTSSTLFAHQSHGQLVSLPVRLPLEKMPFSPPKPRGRGTQLKPQQLWIVSNSALPVTILQ